MLPWIERPTISIDLAQAAEQRYAVLPAEAVAAGKTLLSAVLRELPASVRPLAELIRLRTADRFHAEILGLARRVDADWRDVLLANVSYDLMLAHLGCSTVALPTPRGPVLARNMDWWPEDLLAQASYALEHRRGAELVCIHAGWPGAVGVVSGLSTRGFALALNAVLGPEKPSQLGYPVLLHLRRVLDDARDFDDALARLRDEPLTVSALVTLVGMENRQRVVIERTPSRHALRWPQGDEPLMATNDFRQLFQPEANDALVTCATTCARYDALGDFFRRRQPERDIDDAELLYRLSDPRVIQGITAQHVILRPREGSLRLFVPRRLVESQWTD
jgi:hypothetical protein